VVFPAVQEAVVKVGAFGATVGVGVAVTAVEGLEKPCELYA
jgi:hypothetical protein